MAPPLPADDTPPRFDALAILEGGTEGANFGGFDEVGGLSTNDVSVVLRKENGQILGSLNSSSLDRT